MLNSTDIEDLVQKFLIEREIGINTIHNLYIKNNNKLSLASFKEELIPELRTGCTAFINQNLPLEELNQYLFYIVNAFGKKKAQFNLPKAKTEYICPGCVFLGKDYYILSFKKVFSCEECKSELSKLTDPKRQHFFQTFAIHNKLGYRCAECQRFIPQPLDNTSEVMCPYFDCTFFGSTKDLVKMHHPSARSNPEKLILDASKDNKSFKDQIISCQIDVLSQLEISQDLLSKKDSIQEIIKAQSEGLSYNSSNSTIKHKQFVYQAFSLLLDQYPIEMIEYLLNPKESYAGFQHRIFQLYIQLLEQSLPFTITKNKKIYKIDNLLDDNLCLFDGISTFNGIVNDKLVIKNNTQEYYIGGRKATYAKPFYIGKLLNIVDIKNKKSLLHLVKNYSFSKIYMRDIEPNTPVIVSHLRVPPHYQMGGMVYVNRIRKKIIEKARVLI